MSTGDLRNLGTSGLSSSPPTTPNYGSTVPTPPSDLETARSPRCVTGVGFIKTVHGILNIIIIIALVCVIICAGVTSSNNCKQADDSKLPTNAKVSAYNTRNAVLAFAVLGLILILADTILQMTKLINRLPPIFDLIFIITMLVFGGIYLILGCCAAAWEKKMDDTVKISSEYQHQGAAGAASFFLFVAMFAVLGDFLLRLLRPVPHSATS